MALIEHKDPTPSDLKWFGWIFMGFFGVLGTLSWWRSHHLVAAMWLWCVGAGVGVMYYTLKPVRDPFFRLCISLTYPIGWCMSHVILGILYYGLFTPIGLFMRIVRRDPLERRFETLAATYWIPHDPGSDKRRYFKQS